MTNSGHMKRMRLRAFCMEIDIVTNRGNHKSILAFYLCLKSAEQMTQIRMLGGQCENFTFDKRAIDIIIPN